MKDATSKVAVKACGAKKGERITFHWDEGIGHIAVTAFEHDGSGVYVQLSIPAFLAMKRRLEYIEQMILAHGCPEVKFE